MTRRAARVPAGLSDITTGFVGSFSSSLRWQGIVIVCYTPLVPIIFLPSNHELKKKDLTLIP
jgi:hypothetical protein